MRQIEDSGVPLTRRDVPGGAVLAVASLGAFLAFLDATIVNVAFPDIRATFDDASIGTLSWVFNAYNVVFAAFLVAAGRVADLLGRRRLFIGGIAIFTVASALCGLATSAEVLIAARALQALGAAVLVPASLALVLSGFEADRRAHAVGLWGAAAALAAGLGPPLGGALVEIESWRSAFLINIPLGLGAIWLARRTLVESRAPGRRSVPDLRGSLMLAAAVGALTLGIVQGDAWGWTSAGVVGSFAAAVILGLIVGRRVRTHPSPVVDPVLLRVRPFAVAGALTVIAGVGFYAYLLNHILFLTSIWDYSVLEAGLAVAPAALVAAVTAGVFGRVAERHDARLVIAPGAVIWTGAYLWYVEAVGPSPAFFAEWLPGQILSGLGVGMVLPVLGAAGVASVPGGRFATASSILSSTRQLGGVLGIALLVVILGTPAGATEALAAFDDGWMMSAVCFALVAAGTVLIGRPPAQAADPEEEVERPAVRMRLSRPVAATRPPAAIAAPTRDDPVSLLASAPSLAGLDAAWIARLAASSTTVDVRAGEYLMRTGEPPDAMYVVRRGRLEVLRDGTVIDELGRGGVAGELGTLSGAARAADVRAVRDTVLLRIAGAELDAALAASPEAARGMLRQLARRVQAAPANGRVRTPVPRIIAAVAMSQAVDLRAIVTGLERELERFGSLEILWAGDAEALERAELRCDRVVLAVPPDAEAAWTAFAIRHADRLVVLAGDGDPPRVTPSRIRGCELVFCGARPPRATLLRWVDTFQPRHASLIGAGSRHGDDVARLGRRLAGQAVGLVLSGGGARALAHVGVIEELEAHGITIDRVAGVSMGSIIAGLVARGLPAASIDALLYEEFVRRQPLGDYRLSGGSVLRGQRAAAMVTRLFGEETHIEELEREFFCVSVDLVSRSLVEHRRGRVREAVGASSVIPGILPPVAAGQRVLVDGGVLNNLPVDLMARRGDGPVIAVDVTERFEPELAGDGVEGQPASYASLSLRETIVRSITLASMDTTEVARRHADLVVRPDASHAGLFEFHQIDEMREAGRQAARDALVAWSAPPPARAAHPPVRQRA